MDDDLSHRVTGCGRSGSGGTQPAHVQAYWENQHCQCMQGRTHGTSIDDVWQGMAYNEEGRQSRLEAVMALEHHEVN